MESYIGRTESNINSLLSNIVGEKMHGNYIPVSLRRDVYECLKKSAKDRNISMNDMILELLQMTSNGEGIQKRQTFEEKINSSMAELREKMASKTILYRKDIDEHFDKMKIKYRLSKKLVEEMSSDYRKSCKFVFMTYDKKNKQEYKLLHIDDVDTGVHLAQQERIKSGEIVSTLAYYVSDLTVEQVKEMVIAGFETPVV